MANSPTTPHELEPQEEWCIISGASRHYEVSTLGRLRRLLAKSGGCYKYLKGCVGLTGYISVSLGGGIGHIRVHKLVMLTFVGPRPEGMVTCHINGIPSDNRLCNLRYGTQKDNMRDMVAHGRDAARSPKGEMAGNAVLSTEIVHKISEMSSFKTQTEISRMLGLNISTVKALYAGKTWMHLGLVFHRKPIKPMLA